MNYEHRWILCMKSWLLCIKIKITWCVSEGQSIDDHLSLYGEEKSTSIWTPTARLKIN